MTRMRETTMTETGRVAVVILVGLLMAAQGLLAATPGVESAVKATQMPGNATLAPAETGGQRVLFREVPSTVIPTDKQAVLDTTSDALSGNYAAAGVLGLALSVKAEDAAIPCPVALYLHCVDSKNRTLAWRYDGPLFGAVPGEAKLNPICLDRRVGWTMDLDGWTEDRQQALWDDGIRNVQFVRLMMSQNGFDEQAVVIDDIKLFGAGYMPDYAVLAQGLLKNFGVQSVDQLAPEQLALDSNRNGISDVDEIAAGRDPGLAITIAAEMGGVAVEWPCTEGMKYTVYRADSLLGEFRPIASGLQATENGFMTYTDASGAGTGPFFYKVSKAW